MEGRIESHLVAAGNEKWMSERGIFVPSHQAPDTTAVYLARDGVCLGYLQLSDAPKSNAIDAIGRLNALGIRHTVMLTGDRSESANSIASILGITEVHAELLPQDKAGILSEMIRDRSKEERIGFVGDGINDAPSLSLCDVGIAMGALGSEAAMESADVVLMDDDLMRIPQAVSLAKRCMRIVRLNTAIILFAKVAALLLVSLGIGGMWLAIFSDVGIMLLTLLFSLSLFRSTNG